jgi:superfamily II DNA or RNA helicase
MPPFLKSRSWETLYRHEDGNLVDLFYVPALECAVDYDRMTGYFTADALALAARGIEKVIANKGRMRLLVGCTLSPNEVVAIERGYDLRKKIEERMLAENLDPPDPTTRGGLEALAWMIANNRLDVKVAIPVNDGGKPVADTAVFHEKVGIITDAEGSQISFSGSVNESRNGWLNNRESFHVHLSWEGGREWKHVSDEVEAFADFWEGRAKSVRVIDVPDAVREKLLSLVRPEPIAPVIIDDEAHDDDEPPVPVVIEGKQELSPEERRRQVWAFIRDAASLPNGLRVGEVTSAVSPWPHQLRAFKRLIDSWPCQMLIADEVGLGKTITAGLVIRQAWISGLAKRVLLLVPKSVMQQWQDELYEKFNLNVPIYDGHKLLWKKTQGFQGPAEKTIARDKWHDEPFVICSSHLMRRRDRAAQFEQAAAWDLVIVDEAHHARRKSPGTPQQGGPNNLLRLLQAIRPKAKSLLLLSATPMQVHPVELWDLLNLLGLPEGWRESPDAFLTYFTTVAGNPSNEAIGHLATMFQKMESYCGQVTEKDVSEIADGLSTVDCRVILKALRDKSAIPLRRLSADQRRAALTVLRRFSPIRHRMSRHTRDLLREYYKRGMISSPIAERIVRDVEVEMTPSERALYDAVEDYISTTYNNASTDKKSAVGFVMTIYRRRLASSFAALQHTLNNRLSSMAGGTVEASDEDVSQDEDREEVMDSDEAGALAQAALVVEEQQSIKDLLKQIAKVGANTKGRVLVEELGKAWEDGYDSAIVFTQYTDTMDWLKEHLATEMPGKKIGCYSGRGGEIRDTAGQWNPVSKEQIKRRLRSGEIQILLCTDAAAEGLNFQVCGVLVNYDLPWNPMKVEQRIGRIDRIGQKYPKIRIINLAYKDTVEADVYFAVGKRIQLFQGLVGKLQPILSTLPKRIEAAVLAGKGNKDAERQRLVADVDKLASEIPAGGLDIDEVAKDALTMPALPPPAMTLDDIDRVMNHPVLRPPQVEWVAMDAGSYSLQMPGMPQSVRVTLRADTFDDQFESHEFLGPGNMLFERLVRETADGEHLVDVESLSNLLRT